MKGILEPRTSRRTLWLKRCQRWWYLFVLFAIPALIMLPVKFFIFDCVHSGFQYALEHTSLFIVLDPLNLGWATVAAIVSSLAIAVCDRRLQRFWVVAVVWVVASTAADLVAVIHPASYRITFVSPIFLLDINVNWIGGIVVAWLTVWGLAIFHPWPQRCQGTPNAAVASMTARRLRIDIAAFTTGWTGTILLFIFWTNVFVGLPYLWIYGDVYVIMIYRLLDGWSDAALNETITIDLSLDEEIIHVVTIVTTYILILLLFNLASNAVFNYRRSICVWFLVLFSIISVATNGIIILRWPTHILDHSVVIANFYLATLILGFFYGAKGQTKEKVISGRHPRQLNRYVFRAAKFSRRLWFYTLLTTWLDSIRRPVRTLERLMDNPDPGEQRKKLWGLTQASVELTLLITVPLFVYFHLSYKDIIFRYGNYILLIISVLLGGVVYHFVFNIFFVRSKILRTLLIYSVPQFICMPIIAAFSMPLLYSHFKEVERIRSQHIQGVLPVARQMISLVFLGPETGMIYSVLGFGVTILNLAMQFFFLEGFWQSYGIPRARSYSIGILAGFLNAMLLGLTISPTRDVIAYFSGG